MTDLNEARKNLEATLGEDVKKQYFALLRQWLSLKAPISKMQFNNAARKLMTNEEQIHNHNNFILAIFSKLNTTRVKNTRNTADKGIFEFADYTDFAQPSSPMMLPQVEFENRSAASELFVPDSGFIATRIAIQAWENNLEGAEDSVTELVVQLSQMFAKNIITAMVSRKEGYKIRDGKFQYGFGIPVPDPFVRNSSNIIDYTQNPEVEIVDEDNSFRPVFRPSLEHAEQQTAFSYSCGKRKSSDKKLTVSLLYDTLREDRSIIGVHSIHNINLLKIGLQLET